MTNLFYNCPVACSYFGYFDFFTPHVFGSPVPIPPSPGPTPTSWAALIGLSSAASALLLMGALWGVKKRRIAVRSIHSSLNGSLDGTNEAVEVTGDHIITVKSASSAVSATSVLCRCQSQLCAICANEGNNSTAFVAAVIPTAEDLDLAVFRGNWQLVAAIAEEVSNGGARHEQ